LADPTAVSTSVAPCVMTSGVGARVTFTSPTNPRPRCSLCIPCSPLSFFFFMTAMTTPVSLILNASIFQFFNVVVTSVQNHHSTLQEFSERFKYDVISSSLLSSSITAPSTRRRSSDGALSDDSDSNPTTELPPPPPASQPVAHRGPARILSLGGLCLIAIFFDCFLLYVSIVTALYYLESRTLASTRLSDSFAPVRAFPPVCSHLCANS